MGARIVVGILAHVDAGKTTLSEALLYESGARRTLGRVDHKDAFLDTDSLERERGITIYGKTALFSAHGVEFTLVDTPGHVDFSAETERALSVLDCAILVVSGADGVQSHTRTLLRLLERYQVPAFVFVNKLDLAGADRERLMAQLSHVIPGSVDFASDLRDENAAMCDEEALERYLENGTLDDGTLRSLIRRRKLTPVFFGSALRLDGVDALLEALAKYAPEAEDSGEFGARIFKISRDAQGTRLTWLRVTGGTLRAKTPLSYTVNGTAFDEKIDQLRLYSGEKYTAALELCAGMVAAVTGLSHTRPGQGLGAAAEAKAPLLEPVLTYRIILPEETDVHAALPKLRELEDEDPMLQLLWNEHSAELHVRLMGPIQLEILQRRIAERFALDVSFGAGSVVYRETISAPVIGKGHFEPLRHYAEVQLLMEPLERGSGIQTASAVSTDDLALNWQRLIFTHILEREHPGVLTGSALTDAKITLVAGRAHLKHTEGGDFRQAVYRAIRQGLMQAQSVLLEPYYDFRLEVPNACVGRAMTDIQGMGGSVDSPETDGEGMLLTGYAPVSGLRDYAAVLAVYTKGLGRLSCTVRGYEPCRDAERVISEIGYDPERDVENPASSVFCEHGGSVTVPWNEAAARMHLTPVVTPDKPQSGGSPAPPRQRAGAGAYEDDSELQAIFERTYGKVERRAFEPPRPPARTSLDEKKYNVGLVAGGTEYLLVDGYNVIFSWDELKRLAQTDIAAARAVLTSVLSNYQGFRKCVVILVFDAYKVKGNPGSVETVDGVKVVYTKEAQTADAYIERATYELRRERRVRVATSDNLEQVIILGHGATRISAAAFHAEVEAANVEIAALLERFNERRRRDGRLGSVATFKS
ncbi:MAG: TetM/TetW/TetO/TetS family tetracycline resistance ribosomal protection protein [Oscillospiraceae bacterium]|nr:TetM/TetW/TetO/TetS family tetracycline resistance ribosomal protection protein [Oscillospiraceae bacterium]